MRGPIDIDYLDSMYASSEDPWDLTGGWYERRKREILLSSLPRERYRSAFEPGCSIGELTARLADRADSLLAADYHPAAVRTARVRVLDHTQVSVRQMLLPDQWPADRAFDLIVLSEIGYFFTPTAWAQVCELTARSTSPDATVLACHWRHEFAQRTQSTAALHERLDVAVALPKRVHLVDDDFVIDVWSAGQHSVAAAEGRR